MSRHYWTLNFLLILISGLSLRGYEVFNPTGTFIKSALLDYNAPRPDTCPGLDMKEPWYDNKQQNPQFGYDVSLIYFEEGMTATVSAPGNPSLKITDPGFVEWQNLDNLPQTSTPADSQLALMCANGDKRYLAHSMFGSSLTVASGVDLLTGAVANTMFMGAPETTRCDSKNPVGDDSISVYSFGYVYPVELKFYTRRGTTSMSATGGPHYELENACAQSEQYGSSTQNEVSQANRNLFGFSGHLSRDGKIMLFGAPMFRQQAGYVGINYRDSKESITFKTYQETMDTRMYYLCEEEQLDEYKWFTSERGKAAEFSSIICDVDLTYGYSITSLKLSQTDTYIATGGPRAEGLYGKIKIFKFKPGETLMKDTFKFLEPLTGTNFNSGFGTTILGADLDGDGVDELLAGEPYFTDEKSETYNSGVVSIYKYDRQTGQFALCYQLKSPEPSKNNMFGFKVTSIGDADADGGEDFLVTALTRTNNVDYSGRKNQGIVYVYSGRSVSEIYSSLTRINDEPEIVQSFTSSQPLSQLFGFSVGDDRTDLDLNGFSDLIIGDPGKDAQNAHVYFANTVVRLVHKDSIPDKIFFLETGIATDCPYQIKSNRSVTFCQPVNVTLRNKGVLNYDPLYPDDEPILKKWEFLESFQIGVELSKIPDETLVKIHDETRSITFGSSNETNVTFFAYGALPQVYGTQVKLKASSNLQSREIKLKNSDNFKGSTVLAESYTREVALSIGSLADVDLGVTPGASTVYLGQSSSAVQFDVTVRTKSGNKEGFVNGQLQVNLGSESLVGFTSVVSDPVNLVSCIRDKQVLNCRFRDGQMFTEAKLQMFFSIAKLVKGESIQNEISLHYQLSWANRQNQEEPLAADSKLQIKYDAKLQVEPKHASVFNKQPFRSGNQLDYALDMRNLGVSEIRTTKITFYPPKELGVKISPRCEDEGEEKSEKKCSSGICRKYVCEEKRFGSVDKKTVPISLTIKDPDFWSELLREKTSLWFTADYNVVDEAGYETKFDKPKFPKNKEGSVILETIIRKEKAPFPWWIVIVSLAASFLILALIIALIYNKTMFLKKKHTIRMEDIHEDEVIDEDKPVILNRFLHEEDAYIALDRTETFS